MIFTVGLRGSRTATEAKLRASGIPNRPPTTGVPEREDLLGEGLGSVGDGGFWRWRWLDDAQRSGRLRSGVAVGLDGGKGGGLLDISRPNLPRQHELDHHSNTGRGFASAARPPPDVSFTRAEPLCGRALLDSEAGERCAERGRGRGASLSLLEIFSRAGWWLLPSRVTRLVEARQRNAPDLLSRSGCIVHDAISIK